MKYSPMLAELISAFTCLPGVGNKSAQRMAFHLLERNRDGALTLSAALHNAMEHIGHCQQCRNFTEQSVCDICQHPQRQESGQLCVVVADPVGHLVDHAEQELPGPTHDPTCAQRAWPCALSWTA